MWAPVLLLLGCVSFPEFAHSCPSRRPRARFLHQGTGYKQSFAVYVAYFLDQCYHRSSTRETRFLPGERPPGWTENASAWVQVARWEPGGGPRPCEKWEPSVFSPALQSALLLVWQKKAERNRITFFFPLCVNEMYSKSVDIFML